MSALRPIALLFVPGLALTVGLLAGCTPDAPTPPTPTPDASSSTTPVPEPTETAAGDAVDPAMRANIVDAISSGNTAALEGYFAPSVHVTYAASEYEGDVTDHLLLINDLSDVTSLTAVWDFALPDSQIATYRNSAGGSYTEDFPAGAIVGRSSDDKVISLVVSGGLITRILISNAEAALL